MIAETCNPPLQSLRSRCGSVPGGGEVAACNAKPSFASIAATRFLTICTVSKNVEHHAVAHDVGPFEMTATMLPSA